MNKITIPPELRSKFVDDLSLPIKLLQSPYFEYYLSLYWDSMELEKKALLFLNDIEKYSRDGYSKEWYKVKDAIAADIQSQPKYLELQQTVFNDTVTFPLEKGNPYNETFLDKTCVSIDIRSANYTALKHFDESLVLNSKDYNELVSRYTESQTLKESKIFRQLVFEPLLAKKQSQIQRKIIDQVASVLVPALSPVKSRSVSNDELVLAFNKMNLSAAKEMVEKELEKLQLGSLLKVETFDVYHLMDKFFYKKDSTGKITLRNVPAQIYAQCYKKAHNLPLEEMDLFFLDSLTQKVAKYEKSIFE